VKVSFYSNVILFARLLDSSTPHFLAAGIDRQAITRAASKPAARQESKFS